MNTNCGPRVLRFPLQFADVVPISREENANLQAAALSGDPRVEDFIDLVAEEMAAGIHRAVDHWMGQVEAVFHDTRLTTLGRMHAIQDILEEYRQSIGSDLPELPAVAPKGPGYDD
ncbi:MAG: hypothetical protein JST79_18835 [Acidobacteria bacterium]|nr:hypothetical protein [Acidobacteriota bacterium]